MPRGGPLIMENFILPALEANKYGEILKWIKRDIGIFRLLLVHKNNALWIEDYVRVFKDWDKVKNRRPNDSKSYLTESKQRFKNALRKCQSVKELSDELLEAENIQKEKNSLYYMYDETRRKIPKRKKSQRCSVKPKETEHIYEVHPISVMTPPQSPEDCGERYVVFSDKMSSNAEAIDDPWYDQRSSETYSPCSDVIPEENILTQMPQQNQVVPSFKKENGEYDYYDVLVGNGDLMLSSSYTVIPENDILMFEGSEDVDISEFFKLIA